MAKEIGALIKLQVKGGAANPAPPIGPALGAKGVNIMEFCKQFNARTQERAGQILPVQITVYVDKSWKFFSGEVETIASNAGNTVPGNNLLISNIKKVSSPDAK